MWSLKSLFNGKNPQQGGSQDKGSAARSTFDFESFRRLYPHVRITAELRASLETQARAHFEMLPGLLERFATEHLPALVAKRRQLFYMDDYGQPVQAPWRREMEHFLSNVFRLSCFVTDGRDPRHEHEFRLKLLDRIVAEADAQIPSAGAACYDPTCTGVEFENVVESIFLEEGGHVSRTPLTGDQGVDLVVRYADHKLAVQCKRSSNSVGNAAVQEALAGAAFYQADAAWVVSDAPITQSARQLAASVGVRLVDFRLIPEELKVIQQSR